MQCYSQTRLIPLEKTYSGAIKEIRDQQDLQGTIKLKCAYDMLFTHTNSPILRQLYIWIDDRLHECATKGKDWEQCFWFGERTDGDYAISADGSYRGEWIHSS